jgi:hypothetical protein
MPFEVYMQSTIRKRYPASEGWEMYELEKLPDGSIPDFYVVRRNRRGNVDYGIVIDVKDKNTLQPSDIDQIIRYFRQCRADERVIYISFSTEAPHAAEASRGLRYHGGLNQ